MKEPEILVVPETNTAVKDKNILYSDEILNIENYLNKIVIKEVSGICIYSLERCLKMILESNPDAIFYNIQYSKNKETVYFYTNKEISTDSYINRKKYKPLTLERDILIELKELLKNNHNKDNDCISLFEVSNLLKTKENEYIYDLRKILNSEFKEYFNSVSECYDNYIAYSFLNQCSNSIIPVNYNCLVDINRIGVSIVEPYSFLLYCYNKMDYKYFNSCAPKKITSIIKENQTTILKKIYIEIGDCPKWSRPYLYEVRQYELLQEKVKEKKLKLGNKIFSFLKK